MKKLISLFNFFIISVSIFARTLPNGDDVRVSDIIFDDEDVIGVQLGGDDPVLITTPIGKLTAAKGSWVYFYKNGNVKSFEHAAAVQSESSSDSTRHRYRNSKTQANETLVSPLGFVTLTYREKYSKWNPTFSFYESGSPECLYIDADVTIDKTKYSISSVGVHNRWNGRTLFYDSGSKDVWLLKKFSLKDTRNDYGSGVNYTYLDNNKELELTYYENVVELWPDQTIKSCTLGENPTLKAKVNKEDVFIHGKNKDGYDYRQIIFHENGNVASFTIDEVLVTQQGGMKLTIPAGTRVDLWQNGKIKTCCVSNPNIIKIKSKEYHLIGRREDDYKNITFDIYEFNNDGTIYGFSGIPYENSNGYYTSQIADTFYDDGSISRLKYISKVFEGCADIDYDAKYDHYIYRFYNQFGAELRYYNRGPRESEYNWVYYQSDFRIEGQNGVVKDLFNLQDGDSADDLAMIYYDDKGIPKSYTLLKLDENNRQVLDLWGMPIEGTEKKDFIPKVR